jgi:hypothetical protein
MLTKTINRTKENTQITNNETKIIIRFSLKRVGGQNERIKIRPK